MRQMLREWSGAAVYLVISLLTAVLFGIGSGDTTSRRT